MVTREPGLTAYIDRQGEVHTDLERLREMYAGASFSCQLDETMLLAVGLIKIAARSRHLQVKLRPSRVVGTTIVKAMYWLADRPQDRFTATIYDEATGQWQDRILPNSKHAAYALGVIVDEAAGALVGKMQRRSFQPHEIDHFPQLVKSIGCWRAGSGNFGTEDADRLGHEFLEGSFLRVQNVMSNATVSAIGPGLPDFARSSLRPLIGRSLAAHADSSYARSCIDAYRQVAARWEPLAEEVEAKAFWPGRGYLRRRYRRLILPFKNNQGEIEILSATKEFRVPASVDGLDRTPLAVGSAAY